MAQRTTTRMMWTVAACCLVLGVLLRAPLSALLGPVYIGLNELMIRHGSRRHRAGREIFTVTMTDDEYEMRSAEHTTVLSWTSIAHATRIRDHWVLKAEGPGSLVLPASASMPRDHRLRGLLRVKGLVAPSDLPAA